MDNIVGSIADFAHRLRFADLPSEVVHQCRRCVVDTFGVALGAFDSVPTRIALQIAEHAQLTQGARIIGTGFHTIPELAAFANCVMARYLDGNDAYPDGGGHPSDTIASVLALAHQTKADGETICTAIVLAYELYYNLSRTVRVRDKGLDHCFYGAVAGALGAAKVLGLDRTRLVEAVSLAITPNIALDATRWGHLSMWKGCAGGNAARNGVFAAQLAAAGMTGPEKPLEGAHGLQKLIGNFELLPFAGNGCPYAISQVTFKPFLSVAHSQTPITTAMQIGEQVNVEDIEKVTVYTYKWALDINAGEREKWRPTTREAADHSIPYIVAAVLIDREFSDEIFSEERLRDPRILGLIDKVEVKEDPEFTPQFPRRMPCRIEITTRKGEHKVVTNANALGHYNNPMTDDQINAKFCSLAQRTLPPARVSGALDKLWKFDTTADIDTVFDAVRIDR